MTEHSKKSVSRPLFEVCLDEYSGPLQLLLELIEDRKLPITDVALSKVTDDYLGYIRTHSVPTMELADFLVIASRLLLIKSHAILPVPEPIEQEDVGALAAQLRLYKLFVDASGHIESLYNSTSMAFGRERSMTVPREAFHLPEELSTQTLVASFKNLLKQLRPFFQLKQVAMERVASVQERMRELQDAILTRSRFHFSHLVKNGQSKVDVVVSFLALLELVKQQVVTAVQGESFADIELKRVD
jgi:segregation and condensation protein A